MIFYTYLESPYSKLLLVSNGQALSGLYFQKHRHGGEIQPDWKQDASVAPFPMVKQKLEGYFAGKIQTFDVPLTMSGTPFQLLVWEKLQAIPYGTTISYSELASKVGRPGSVRAVGGANAHNPISIIVPCHRVIGADGSLTGYGGGLELKAALLEFEASVRADGEKANGR